MKVRALLVCCAMVAVATTAAAQTSSDIAAWTALSLSPVGAFPGILLTPIWSGGERQGAFALLGSAWKFKGFKDQNINFGGSYAGPIGNRASLTGTLGYFRPGEGGAGTFMFGGDFQTVAWDPATTSPLTFSLFLKGSAGLGYYTGREGDQAVSLVGSVPLVIRYQLANKSAISATVTPGYGWGRAYGGGVPPEGGALPLISFAGSWAARNGAALHVAMQKIIIDGDAPWMWGVALSFVPRSN
jgi:hypothetical protein